jgi:hypothetical protein
MENTEIVDAMILEEVEILEEGIVSAPSVSIPIHPFFRLQAVVTESPVSEVQRTLAPTEIRENARDYLAAPQEAPDEDLHTSSRQQPRVGYGSKRKRSISQIHMARPRRQKVLSRQGSSHWIGPSILSFLSSPSSISMVPFFLPRLFEIYIQIGDRNPLL